MGSLRGAVAASLLAASLTAPFTACGQQHPAGARASQSIGGASSSPSPVHHPGRIDTGLAYFTSATGALPEVHAVLRDKGELTAFAQHFGARAARITAKAEDTDFSRTALVGWSATAGCATWPSATLRRLGARLILVPAPHAKPPPECFAPFHVIAVFEVPKERLPARPHFAD